MVENPPQADVPAGSTATSELGIAPGYAPEKRCRAFPGESLLVPCITGGEERRDLKPNRKSWNLLTCHWSLEWLSFTLE